MLCSAFMQQLWVLFKHKVAPHGILHPGKDFFSAMNEHSLLEHKDASYLGLNVKEVLLVWRPKPGRASFQLLAVLVTVVEVYVECDESLLVLVLEFDETITVRFEVMAWSVPQEAEPWVNP